jgi:hypothetical protein
MTKHNQIVASFLADYPAWQRVGLRKQLNAVLEQYETEPVPALGFVPDAFQIDSLISTVRLLEVDGHSYTDSNKMFLIVNLWYEMDARSWSVELWTVDLFTKAASILTNYDLSQHWHDRFH